MMHIANPSTVVALEDANTGKPFREYDHVGTYNHSRSHARVPMPFGTEYRFRFIFPDSTVRRRLEIDIDGTRVADSLIVTSGCVLERFMDSDKRFKFVPVNAAGVANPASPDNGKITVKLWTEKEPQPDMRSMLRGMRGTERAFHGWGDSSKDIAPMSFNASAAPTYEAGATVEGSKSDQTFGATHWRGDASSFPQVFEFQLVGKGAQDAAVFCSGCGTAYASAAARFCSACGAKK